MTDITGSVQPLLSDPKRFQQLTESDLEIYRHPRCCQLQLPRPTTDAAQEKLDAWIQWRAAPYQADRHSEYLFVCDQDIPEGPRILVSAVLDISGGLAAYCDQFNKKQRRKITGRKAELLGYKVRPISPAEHAGEIAGIIGSAVTRQGRQIAERYAGRSDQYSFPDYIDYGDPQFNDICVGVFSANSVMVAYLLGKRVGDHIQYDEIMGHKEHLKNDIMELLHYEFLRICSEQEVVPKCLNYGPWYSGSSPYSAETGLNFWKRKLRFQPSYLMIASSSEGSRDRERRC